MPTKPLAATLLLVVFLPLSLGAATFTVTKTEDDNGPCTPEDCALREAIIAANETPGRDLIVLPEGTYRLSIADSADEETSRSGDLDVSDDLDLVGEGMPTIVGNGSSRLLEVLGSEIQISGIQFTGGTGRGSGGGIRIVQGTAFIRDSVISKNRSVADAGGIFLQGSDATLINCLVEGNEALRNGGGIRRVGFVFAFATLTLINTTVSGNSAATGGGIFSSERGDLILRNSTIANNDATVADGIFFFEAVAAQLTNTLIADDGCRFALTDRPDSGGGNIESPGATCFLEDPTDRMSVPDAGLAPLGHYGGPTPTHALLDGSPAIDTANDAECEPNDQRGFPRPQDGDGDGVARCDVGAVEFTPSADSVLPTAIPALDRVGLLAFAVLVAVAAWRILA